MSPSVVSQPEADPLFAQPAWKRSRWAKFGSAAVVVAALLAGLLWWSTTSGRMDAAGMSVGVHSVTVGSPYYFGYQIPVTDGDIQIDSIHLARPPAGVSSSFLVARGPCPIGSAISIPEYCDPVEPEGVVVQSGTDVVIIGGYRVDRDGTYDLGPMVVSYHAGLHQRTATVDPSGCLSTEPTLIGCTQTFPTPG